MTLIIIKSVLICQGRVHVLICACVAPAYFAFALGMRGKWYCAGQKVRRRRKVGICIYIQ